MTGVQTCALPISSVSSYFFVISDPKIVPSERFRFPNDTALLKALYLATLQATKKWGQPLRNWAKVYGEFSIMYEGRLPD